VRQHVGLAADRPHKSSITADHERRPLPWQRSKPLGAKKAMNLAVRVAEQREPQSVGFVELLLPIDPISADPHSLGAEFSELGGQVTEMTAFLRSTRRHGLRIKEQHDRP